jgi:hypothetical protein
MLKKQIKEEVRDSNLFNTSGLLICWLIQILVLLPPFVFYKNNDEISYEGDNSFLIIIFTFSFISNIFVMGILTYYLSAVYLKKIIDRNYLIKIHQKDKFKIFLIGNNFHFKGKYNYKVISSKQKAIFPVNSKDISEFKENLPSCGKLMSLYDIRVQVEFADEKTKYSYLKLHEEMRERNLNMDKNFDIEYSYDFDNFSDVILISNNNCVPFIGIFWWILFTLIFPLGALYQTFLFFTIERKRYIIKKLISIDIENNNDISNKINVFDIIENDENVLSRLV